MRMSESLHRILQQDQTMADLFYLVFLERYPEMAQAASAGLRFFLNDIPYLDGVPGTGSVVQAQRERPRLGPLSRKRSRGRRRPESSRRRMRLGQARPAVGPAIRRNVLIPLVGDLDRAPRCRFQVGNCPNRRERSTYALSTSSHASLFRQNFPRKNHVRQFGSCHHN